MVERLLYNCNKLSLEYFDKILNENVWKAFTTIHAGIHHQMRFILWYKSIKNNEIASSTHPNKKWDLIYDKRFAGIVNDLFITGAIDENFKGKILTFNTHRNRKIGHIDIYEAKEPSDEEIRQICLEGIEIIKGLDEIIHNILFPKARSKQPS
jgi:hypothetical protein